MEDDNAKPRPARHPPKLDDGVGWQLDRRSDTPGAGGPERDMISTRRLLSAFPLAKRLLRVNVPFVATVALLVILSGVSVKMLSAVRAYVGAESLWAKGEKEAAYFLDRYERTHDETDFRGFERNIAVPLGDHRARLALSASPPDLEIAREGIIAARNHPDDVTGMIYLFRYFGHVTFMADAIAIWTKADGGIAEITGIASQIHHRVQAGDANAEALHALVDRVNVISRQLTPLEEEFSRTLGVASRKTERILLLTMLGLSSTLVGFSILLSRRLMVRNDLSEGALRLSEERLTLAVSGSNHGVWDWDVASGTTYYSPRVTELLEIPAEASRHDARSPLDLMHPDDVAGFRGALVAHLRRDTAYDIEIRLRAGSGGYRWFRSRGQALRNTEGRVVRMAGSITDVTDRKLAEAARQRYAMQQALIAGFGRMALANPGSHELMAEAVRVVGIGLGFELCRLMSVDATAGTLKREAGFGWDAAWSCAQAADVTEEAGDRFVTGARDAIVVADTRCESGFDRSEMLRFHEVRSGTEMLIQGTHGIYALLGVYARAPARSSTECVDFLRGIANMLASTLDRKWVEDRLTYMAQYDSLTGLPNRSMYLDRLEHSLAQARRSGALIAVLFIDLDHFKVVNDTHGHGAGDDVLVQAAQRLKDCLRSGDTVGRLGGDEFAAVLGDLTCADDAGQVARKIVDALTRSFCAAGHDVHVSASIGISMFPFDGTEPLRLLMNADMAMYRSKEMGRNTFAFFGSQKCASVDAQSLHKEKRRDQGAATRCQPEADAIVHAP